MRGLKGYLKRVICNNLMKDQSVKIFHFPVVLICIQLSGCSDERTLVTFPLLDECRIEVVNVLDSFRDDGISHFDYEIKEFSIGLYSHPTLNNIVEMSSKVMDRDSLIRIANNPIASCYPNTSYRVELKDEAFSEKLLREYLLEESVDSKPKYSISDMESITIYSDDF